MLASRSTCSRSTTDSASSSASSSALMTVSVVSPWRTALRRDACLPASVFGPVLLRALRRLASIWRYEVMVRRSPNWVRVEVLIPAYHFWLAVDGSSAIAREPRRQHRYRSCPTTRLRHRSDAPRDDDHGRAGP